MLGYAPDSGDALTSFLLKKGFSKQELSQAGLVNRFGGDLFRGRMMVPLMDSAGQVIGFTGRIIADDPNAPKYLNTPQTLLYDKSRHVFGLSQAKEAIRQLDYAVVVEGNLDVVSSHQAGVKQVVATAGTALTEYHLKALGRLSGNVRFSFDGDRAGIAATERAIPIAQKVGVEVTIISLPDGSKDPDELIKKDIGAWQKAIETAEPVVDWILKQYEAREDLSAAAGKRRFTTAALDVVRSLSDPVEQDHYLNVVSKMSGASLSSLREKLAGVEIEPEKPLREVRPRPAKPVVDSESYQDNLLALLLTDVATHDLLTTLDPSSFAGEQRQEVAAYLKKHPAVAVVDTPENLQNLDEYVKILLLKADARYADWSDKDRYDEAARLIRQLVTEHKKQQKETLTSELREAEAAGDDIRAREIRETLNNLIKEANYGR